ncbi:beta-1,6-N-acetylglucosaminyltransferase [Microbacterium sp. MYb66]|uniref:beta-1,6-N-acetylglucosaminyltransferase n=1 Tax=Microbacterium sp. MYb66 TaxID=1848692 RepID=UPI000CFFB771|nr:beta-1,6-N-acetylglucosaminyltransferase [Microbacterium sp. MYb66]
MEKQSADTSTRAAFVITSHADIPLLRRLVDRLLAGSPDVRVYISHDIAGEPGVEDLVGPRCTVIREVGGRGDFTQIERIVSLFRLVEADGGADYVTVLSGMDYPARPISDFLDALTSAGDGYLHNFPALDPQGSDWAMHEARQRYLYRWWILWPLSASSRRRWHWLHGVNYVQPFLRVNISYGTFRLAWLRGRLPNGMTVHGGSAWFTISRRAVRHVLATVDSRPDILRWARTSLAVDEVFFQSILLSAGTFDFINSNARYIDFESDGFGHPKVLTEEDLERIDASDAYFIRKVDRARSATLLDKLDERVTGREADDR